MNQQSLPQLQKFKQIAQTPDENSKRIDEVTRLKQQVVQLQKQIEFVQQNKSFVMKIQNQQCTLCLRYKTQIEQLIKQEKQSKKQYEQKIEELLLSLNQQISKQKLSQIQQTDHIATLNKEIQVEISTEQQPQQNQIENLKQSPLVQQYEEIIIDFHKDYQNKVYQVLQYKELYEKQKQQYEQFKSQHINCNDKIHKLQIEINLLKDNSNQYKLPDIIILRNIFQIYLFLIFFKDTQIIIKYLLLFKLYIKMIKYIKTTIIYQILKDQLIVRQNRIK